MRQLPFLDAEALSAFGYSAATDALELALREGLDPAGDIPRGAVPLEGGEFLLMPSQSAGGVGLKVITVAPGNPERGSPRIQGVYLLFDGVTLAPVALADGAAVTSVRTPAVSMLIVRRWAAERSGLVVVVVGAGPQGTAHAEALRAELGDRLKDLIVAARRPQCLPEAWCAAHGVRVVGTEDLPRLLPEVDAVICATTASDPVFDSAALRGGALVVAVGSHTPDARELDSALLARAQVIVEDVDTACREAGDVVIPMGEGALVSESLVPLAEVVTGRRALESARPVVFKTTGMSWEDLVVVAGVWGSHDGDGIAE